MRISTGQMYLRGFNGMQKQQLETLKLQQQLSSGKRVQTPSDDPISSAKIDLLKQRIQTAGMLKENNSAAKGTLSFEESILSNVVGVVHRIKELQVQAGNSSMSPSDRLALSAESANLLEQIQGLANTQDNNGNYIFSGAKSLTESITKNVSGAFVFNGDSTQRFQSISSGLQISLNDTADTIFMNIKNGNGRFVVKPSAPPNGGTVVMSSGSVTDDTLFVEDNYTVQFSLNSQNKMVVMISGAISGNVLPASGNVDDAALYDPTQAISFNGIEVSAQGVPVAGDRFLIQPSKNESLFSTVQRMVNNLKKPFDTAIEKAATQTENNQLLMQLDSALDSVLQHQSIVGARLNQLDVADLVNEDLMSSSEETLSVLENVDMAAAAVSLNLQLIYLQAAQQSFAKIQGLSLFNFLR